MALTTVTLTANTTKPKDVGYLAISTGTGEGLLAKLTAASAGSSETGVNPQIIEIVSDTDYYWSFQDSQTAADGTMVKVLARQVVRCEITNTTGLTMYMRASTGTAKMSVVQV